MNLFFVHLKMLKKHGFHFLKARKTQKTWILFIASFTKLKHVNLMFCELIKHKYMTLIFCMLQHLKNMHLIFFKRKRE